VAHEGDGAADRFLSFLEQELHREVMPRFRVEPGEAAIYGHAQGGLFTLYALASGSTLFNIYGAGSPGLASGDSQIYALYERLVAKTESSGRDIRLHLNANEQEMTGSVALYRLIGAGFLKFVDLARNKPLRAG
jgi:predicted alpha/beta superfamily hydrolase